MLAHLVIGLNDVEASKRFYDPVLKLLASQPVITMPSDNAVLQNA